MPPTMPQRPRPHRQSGLAHLGHPPPPYGPPPGGRHGWRRGHTLAGLAPPRGAADAHPPEQTVHVGRDNEGHPGRVHVQHPRASWRNSERRGEVASRRAAVTNRSFHVLDKGAGQAAEEALHRHVPSAMSDVLNTGCRGRPHRGPPRAGLSHSHGGLGGEAVKQGPLLRRWGDAVLHLGDGHKSAPVR